ncbi:hypothetical protein AAC387_Pa07g2223 [Persea americana]
MVGEIWWRACAREPKREEGKSDPIIGGPEGGSYPRASGPEGQELGTRACSRDRAEAYQGDVAKTTGVPGAAAGRGIGDSLVEKGIFT